MSTKTTTIEWLNSLRTFATLGVIILHISTPVLKMTYGKNMDFWWIGNGIDSTVRFVIAMFLMLSGATMLHKEYKLNDFYLKRCIRVLVPFLFWSAIYCIYLWVKLPLNSQPHDVLSISKWAIQLFLDHRISNHFWYVYMIVVLYLFIPFLGKMVRKLSSNNIWLILFVWVLVNTAQTLQLIQFTNWPVSAQKYIGYLLYAGYLLVGYQLMKLQTPSFKTRIAAFSAYICTVIIAAVATYFLSKQAQKLDTTMYGTLTLNTMLQSVALFILLKGYATKYSVSRWIVSTISNYSYGIYLAHILIINLLFDHNFFWTMAHPLISLPIIFITVLLCSVTVVFLIRKVPGAIYISG